MAWIEDDGIKLAVHTDEITAEGRDQSKLLTGFLLCEGFSALNDVPRLRPVRPWTIFFYRLRYPFRPALLQYAAVPEPVRWKLALGHKVSGSLVVDITTTNYYSPQAWDEALNNLHEQIKFIGRQNQPRLRLVRPEEDSGSQLTA